MCSKIAKTLSELSLDENTARHQINHSFEKYNQTLAEKYLTQFPLDELFNSKYKVEYELGNGGFGFVLGAKRRSDDQPVAIKFIFKDKIQKDAWATDRKLGTVPMEVYILSRCNHPNIITFLDYFDHDQFACLVTTLHGTHWNTLHDTCTQSISSSGYSISSLNQSFTHSFSPSLSEIPAIERSKTAPIHLLRRPSMDLFECIEQNELLSESKASYIFTQIVSAINYLHGNGIIHRDIKDENIVIDDHLNVKLIDFGSASIEKTGPNEYLDKFQGTIQYCPPEILKGDKFKGRPADIWALGILLYTMLCGEIPFTSSEQVRSFKYNPPRRHLSSAAQDLISRLLQKDPSKRPRSDEIQSHEWMNASIDEL